MMTQLGTEPGFRRLWTKTLWGIGLYRYWGWKHRYVRLAISLDVRIRHPWRVEFMLVISGFEFGLHIWRALPSLARRLAERDANLARLRETR